MESPYPTTGGTMIEVQGLTKRFGDQTAVDGLTFSLRPGAVTGFLGANGAGKTTTLRLILGLERPTSGTALVGGRRFAEVESPMREVGALLDAGAVHGSRTARDHLRCLAASNRIPDSRVEEVLGLVGLEPVGGQRVRTFSLGMRQRLGIAGALLGDPKVVIFDEPVNGLDPQGVVWIRTLTRELAQEGKTVLISSHLMGEVARTADHILVIGRGKLLADAPAEELMREFSRYRVLVDGDNLGLLAARLRELGADVEFGLLGKLEAVGLTSSEIFKVAMAEGIVLSELTPQESSLEEVFMDLTKESVGFGAAKGDR
uniref:PyrJ3 n=1 Tax=Streptomyces rugosporus TaxID=295838 RepID=K7QQC0_STRRG|nr:PyrJ3 [Streptomyces rugosporus]